jgi:hypothetical protein
MIGLYIQAYTILYNVLSICEFYLSNNTKEYIEKNYTQQEPTIYEYLKLFETFKLTKTLFKKILTSEEICQINFFYFKVIEGRINYQGCINLVNRHIDYNNKIKNQQDSENFQENNFESQFGCNIKAEEGLDRIASEYIENYYETERNQKKRIYKTEHAGINWTEEDVKNFNEGLRLFGHCQLANNKIAKYMGSHIHVNHVKLFRSKISKEKQKTRKMEKQVLIKEMKKKKNWKIANIVDEHHK